MSRHDEQMKQLFNRRKFMAAGAAAPATPEFEPEFKASGILNLPLDPGEEIVDLEPHRDDLYVITNRGALFRVCRGDTWDGERYMK